MKSELARWEIMTPGILTLYDTKGQRFEKSVKKVKIQIDLGLTSA